MTFCFCVLLGQESRLNLFCSDRKESTEHVPLTFNEKLEKISRKQDKELYACIYFYILFLTVKLKDFIWYYNLFISFGSGDCSVHVDSEARDFEVFGSFSCWKI